MGLRNNENRSDVYRAKIDLNSKNTSHTQLIDFASGNSDIFDVGCACGDMGVVLHSAKGCRVWGVDGDAGSVSLAKASGAYEDVQVIDLDNLFIEGLGHFQGRFQNIIFGDVLEHLVAPEQVLLQFQQFLQPGGSFLISLPNAGHASVKMQLLDDKWEYTEVGILDKTHLKFYTYKTIAKLLASASLRIFDLNYTVLDEKGYPESDAYKKVPLLAKFFIYKDPHSFIMQYVMQARPVSGVAQADLAQENLKMLSISYSTMPSRLKRCMRKSSFAMRFYMYFLSIINVFKR